MKQIKLPQEIKIKVQVGDIYFTWDQKVEKERSGKKSVLTTQKLKRLLFPYKFSFENQLILVSATAVEVESDLQKGIETIK